jgi:hypothetical protein
MAKPRKACYRETVNRWSLVAVVVCVAPAFAVDATAQEAAGLSIGVRGGLAWLGPYHDRCAAGHVTGGLQVQYLREALHR